MPRKEIARNIKMNESESTLTTLNCAIKRGQEFPIISVIRRRCSRNKLSQVNCILGYEYYFDLFW